jgi:DNA-binding response OmpR family regulator
MSQSNPVILVIEDDPYCSEMLSDLVGAAGYAVERAADGHSGLARVAQGGIDLVLLDVMLPEMDGLQICQRLRASSTGPYLPIIMVSALGTEEQRHDGFAAGADDYITKPFRVQDLLDRVRVWVQTRHRLEAAYEQVGVAAAQARLAEVQHDEQATQAAAERLESAEADAERAARAWLSAAQARLAEVEAERAAREAREAVARVATARRQAELDAWYEQGVTASQRGDWTGAYRAFGEVERLDPGYRDTAARLAAAWGQLERAARSAELPAPEAEPTPVGVAEGSQAEPIPIRAADGAPALAPRANDEPESDWLTPRQRADAARRRNQDSGDGWLTPRQRAEAARRRAQEQAPTPEPPIAN